ncbi:MAG: 5'-nucleotidase, partial [Pseudomonadota bacterium]
TPLIHPQTGTLIMQTYGQAQHLGVVHLEIDASGRRVAQRGQLVEVQSEHLQPDPRVAAKLALYRNMHTDIYTRVGSNAEYLSRRYYEESDLGNLFADILRTETGAQIGLVPSGALRKDLPMGLVRKIDLLDAFPFEDHVALVEVSGQLLMAILEQGLSLERGLLQVSGLIATYDPTQPAGQRLLEVRIDGERLQTNKTYTIATLEILARGGDAYVQFKEAESTTMRKPFAEALEAYFGARDVVEKPQRRRLIPLDQR